MSGDTTSDLTGEAVKACIVHGGAPAYGCRDCNAGLSFVVPDPKKVEEAADDIYARGFADGVKWLAAGLKSDLNTTLRKIDRATKRVIPRTPQATGTAEGAKEKP